MNRFLVEDLFGKISIAWYGVIICFAMILACAIILFNAVKKEGYNLDSFLDYFIFTIPIGVIGARAMYVLARLEEYDSFSEMVSIWNGGLAIYGGVIAGVITVFVISKIKKQKVLKVYDAIIPGLLIAQSIGRWGNFINGEAYGDPKIPCNFPWGMMVNGTGPVHPTFLYESIITLIGFILAMFVIYRFKKADGQVFAFYLLWYGIGRVLIEGLRGDSLMVGPLRLAQCIGIASALLGIALFLILALYGKKEDAVSELKVEETSVEEKAEGEEEKAEEPSEEVKEEKKARKPRKKKETPAEEKAEDKEEQAEEPSEEIKEEKKARKPRKKKETPAEEKAEEVASETEGENDGDTH
ncbi:MAG: prolipoprotein diacylglyceryl transferase [Clostridia bacterium]|nr:prolipoprotein diacylglyceryl transferase [Clostridia bacterium]